MQCPICKTPLELAGRTYKCERCDGAWVRSDVLVPVLEERASALVELDWQPGTEEHVRACPECSTPMRSVKLGSVLLDRCDQHGVWFDAKELAELLKEAKQFRAEPAKHQSLLHTLRKLFER